MYDLKEKVQTKFSKTSRNIRKTKLKNVPALNYKKIFEYTQNDLKDIDSTISSFQNVKQIDLIHNEKVQIF